MIDSIGNLPFGIPTTLRYSSEVYVLYFAGAAYNEIIILARPEVDPQTLARILDSAIAKTRFESEPVEWEQAVDFSAARAHFPNGKIMSLNASTLAPVGFVIAGIKRGGLHPYAILRIPEYATAPILPQPGVRGNGTWYYATNFPVDLSLNVSAAVPISSALKAFAAMFSFPVVILLSICIGILVARSNRIHIDIRRRFYIKIIRYSFIIGFAIYILSIVVYAKSVNQLLIGDIWFGRIGAASTKGPLMMLPFLAILLLAPITAMVEKKLFGHAQGTPQQHVNPKEKRLYKYFGIASIISMILGLFLLFGLDYLDGVNKWLYFFTRCLGFGLAFFGPILVQQVFKRSLKKYQKISTDDGLTARANVLAENIGVAVKHVNIDEGTAGIAYAMAFALPGQTVRVTRKLIDVLTPEEVDFILAHEIAHLKKRHIPRQIAIVVFAFVLLQIPFFLPAAGIHISRGLALLNLLFSLTGLLLLFGGTAWLSRKREREADRIALETTRNLDAAVSSLVKIIQCSPHPYIHDIDDFSTHPKISKRLNTLRQQAKKMGLVSTPLSPY